MVCFNWPGNACSQMKQETQNQHHLTAPARSISVWCITGHRVAVFWWH